MVYGEKISIEVDGVTVRGRAKIEDCDFSVQIVSPFHWLSAENHIRSFSRLARPYEGEKGLARVKEALVRLYRLGCFLRDHMEKLQGAYDEVRARIRDVARGLELSEYTTDKDALRSRLESGEIDNAEYQKQLLKLRQRKDDFQAAYRRIHNEFFEKQFSEDFSSGNHEQILQILDNPSLLFFGTTDPR